MEKSSKGIREELEMALSEEGLDIINYEIYIWGTGNTAQLYVEGFERLETAGELYISGFCDNNASKWGTEFWGKPVISPDELQRKTGVCALICSGQPEVVQILSKELKSREIPNDNVDSVILKMHKREVLACYDMLEDIESKRTYAGVIISRMRGSYPDEKLFSENQYFAFPKFRFRNPKEVFVDCGAFVGDTIEQYINMRCGVFHKIIAFEPDQNNYFAMKARICRLQNEWNVCSENIEYYPYGIGDKSKKGFYECYDVNNGLSSKLVESLNPAQMDECRIVCLDDFIKENVSFLKADIESYEYKMLLGGEKIIRDCHPLMAVCIYHNAVDLYSVPLLIKKIVPEYKVGIRQHSYMIEETVLYAWV